MTRELTVDGVRHYRERGATDGGKWAYFCHEDDEEWPCSAVRTASPPEPVDLERLVELEVSRDRPT